MADLDFTLSLIDNITRPIRQVQSSVTGFAQQSQAAFGKVAIGVGALWGVGASIKGALDPAIQMFDAMQEASARGINDDVLAKVTDDALKFSTRYGESAVEFVKSTADINAAVSGLTSAELPRVTMIANTAAKALKSTAGEASEFMGQMFTQFSGYAAEVGKVQFAEELAGKMAYMKNQFGTDMATIKDLMEGARGVGSNYGVGMDEQLAVLGELQRSLGTEASGSYEGFLSGAAAGAQKLGLSFQDAQGKMLSMPAMLEKLQGKYGKSIEGNLKAQAELDAAFGDSSAVIKQLYGNVDLLKRNITELGSNDGMKRATEMAEKMTRPWDRLTAIWFAMRAAIGATLLPVLYPLVNKIADGGEQLTRWMRLFPNIARVIGYATLALLSFAAFGAMANIVVGVGRFVLMGWQAVMVSFTAITKLGAAAIWIYNTAIRAWSVGMAALRGVLLAVRMAAVLSGVAFNFMSLPVLLVVGAVALLAAGFYLLIRHWDELKAAIMQTEAFKALAAYVEWLTGIYSKAWETIVSGWHWLVDSISNFSLFDGLAGMAESIGNVFGGLWDWLKKSFSGTYNWIVEKLNMIPGIDIEAKAVTEPQSVNYSNGLSTGGALNIGRGGLSKEMNSNSKTTVDNSKTIGTVNIHPPKGMTPGELMEWQELN
ncbi:phage tail tape measure protein [Rahnella inusitata]|uniref:phage tail tape measure protein n=1 Tax=Rahnella inusitata TaxID=58169 RepID=UPI0039AF85C5